MDISKITTLFDYAEQIFERKYPNTNVHATISIQNGELNYKQNEKSKLAEKLADMVQWTRREIDVQ